MESRGDRTTESGRSRILISCKHTAYEQFPVCFWATVKYSISHTVYPSDATDFADWYDDEIEPSGIPVEHSHYVHPCLYTHIHHQQDLRRNYHPDISPSPMRYPSAPTSLPLDLNQAIVNSSSSVATRITYVVFAHAHYSVNVKVFCLRRYFQIYSPDGSTAPECWLLQTSVVTMAPR